MALIRCKNCGHVVSTKATSCPQCGYPVRLSMNQGNALNPNPHTTSSNTVRRYSDDIEPEQNSRKGILVAIIVILVICCGVLLFMLNKKQGNNSNNLHSSVAVADTEYVENNNTEMNENAESSSCMPVTSMERDEATDEEFYTDDEQESIILYGTMTDENGMNPIEISYKKIGNELKDCIYTNIELGGKIKMNGMTSGGNLIFTGKDGMNKFQIVIDRESYEGTATDGPKELRVSLHRKY